MFLFSSIISGDLFVLTFQDLMFSCPPISLSAALLGRLVPPPPGLCFMFLYINVHLVETSFFLCSDEEFPFNEERVIPDGVNRDSAIIGG